MPITAGEACERFRDASWIVAAADSRLLHEWGPGEPVASLRIAGFAQTLSKYLKSFRPEDLRSLIGVAEACLTEGDDAVRATVASCFFGSLRSVAEQGLFDPSPIEPLLGAESARCWSETRAHATPARRQGAA